jgi:hypothetical protein
MNSAFESTPTVATQTKVAEHTVIHKHLPLSPVLVANS